MKIVAGLIVAFMVQLSLAAAMYTNEVNGVKWFYTVNDDGESAVIAGVDYSTISERVTVPDRVDGLTVSAIGGTVFAYCHDVREIVLPDSVEHIGAGAFYACDNLAHVNLPSRLETVGAAAFQWSGLTGSIFVSDATTNIAAQAFYGCDGMESISIPGTVCEIGAGAFALNYNLREINVRQIAGSVNRFRSIDGAVYSYDVKTLLFCPGGKTTIYIPASVDAIDESCFAQDFNLENIDVASGNAMFASENGILYTRDRTSLILCPARKTSLTIPSTVTNICDWALYGSRIESVTIPAKVCQIGKCVFSACIYLESINVDSKNAWYKSIDGILYSKDGSVLVAAPGGRSNISVSSQTSEIGKYAFFTNDKIDEISLPGTITKILFEAFGYCYALREAMLPYGVRIIDEVAFFHCPELETAMIPSSVSLIGMQAFAECSKLSDLTISRGVHEIGGYAFADCTALEMVTIPPSVDRMGMCAFVGCSNLWYVRAPRTMKDAIEENQVFADCADDLYIDYYDVSDCFVQCFAAPEQPEASGTATMSPSAGTMKFGTAVTLTAKAGNASTVFAYWTDDSGNIVGYSPTLKVFPEKDTNYSAVFRVKTKCEAPKFDMAESYTWVDGGELSITVNEAAYPVKFSAKNLPTGLKIDSNTGVISGTPTKPGVYAVTVTATNASATGKDAAVCEFTLTVPNLTDGEIPVADGYGPFVPGVEYAETVAAATGCTVTGLPSGMKWTAKDVVDTKTKAVKVPANSFYGAATKPGSYTVYFTKTVGKTKRTATATFTVGPFPRLAVEMSGSTGKDKATGAGDYAANKKVTLKATPDKGKVFAGWYDAEGEPLAGAADYRTASFPYVTTDTNVTLTAAFATEAEDIASLKVSLEDDSAAPDGTYALELGPRVESVSLPKLAVKGLPSGLKYDAKTLTISGKATKPGVYAVKVEATNASVKKATPASTGEFVLTVPNFGSGKMPGLKYETDAYGVLSAGVALDPELIDCTPADGWAVKVAGLPAGLKYDAKTGVISGVPTAKAGSYTVTFTVTKGKEKETATITLNVAALPDWAVGTFDGVAERGTVNGERGTGEVAGLVSLTIDAKGKISGKILEGGQTWTFSAASFSAVEGPASNVDDLVLRATVVGKADKAVMTNEITVASGTRDACPYQWGIVSGWSVSEPSEQPAWFAYQNLWKRADTKAAQPVFKKNIEVNHYLDEEGEARNLVKLTFKKDGAVAFAGMVGGVKVSGSSQLVWNGGWSVTIYAPPKGTFGGFCETCAVTLAFGDADANVVTAVDVALVDE